VNPKRKNRLYMAGFLLVAVGGTVTALMFAMQEDLNMFYPPEKVVSGEVPTDRTIRAGGMVLEGSVQRQPSGLEVRFMLTDRQASEFEVRYTGILPDLFREGQGVLVRGRLDDQAVFYAEEVLAKHDENYMPPELLDMAKNSG
jgi:cytochrome c-type biogenesis protein CcmE